MLERHSALSGDFSSQMSCLLFSWSLTYIKIQTPPDVGPSWACQGWELRQVRRP